MSRLADRADLQRHVDGERGGEDPLRTVRAYVMPGEVVRIDDLGDPARGRVDRHIELVQHGLRVLVQESLDGARIAVELTVVENECIDGIQPAYPRILVGEGRHIAEEAGRLLGGGRRRERVVVIHDLDRYTRVLTLQRLQVFCQLALEIRQVPAQRGRVTRICPGLHGLVTVLDDRLEAAAEVDVIRSNRESYQAGNEAGGDLLDLPVHRMGGTVVPDRKSYPFDGVILAAVSEFPRPAPPRHP